MPSEKNIYGLTREIPEDVKRIVRRECGFGCAICGLAIAQYDHFDPPFKKAKEHNPAGIVALCGSCHDRKSRGFWSDEKVAKARKNPVTFQVGYSRDAFDLQSPFVLGLGSSLISNVSTIIRTEEGERWFVIEDTEFPGGPVRLSALFFDKDGQVSLEIRGNEWRCFSGQWDLDVVGKTITVRRRPKDIALELVVDPPHVIRLTRLVMQKGDLGITIEPPGIVTLKRGEGITIFDDNFVSGADSVFIV